MILIVEDAVKSYNAKQRATESIRATFRKVNQDPWRDLTLEFCRHLDSLEENSMYKRLLDNQTRLDISE